ncbi:MAG: hypothetical protein QM680_14235 [Luteolibacter sp.]
MKRVWQVVALWVCLVISAGAEEWHPLQITKSVFSPEIGLLDSEREDYANQLATYAANVVGPDNAVPPEMEQARKALALALQLSPRNKQAVVLNFQLAKGIFPKASGDVKSGREALAKLLFARAELLKKQGGEENLKLSRYFAQLAAEMEPKNVDYVYASELNRIELGELDWNVLMNP